MDSLSEISSNDTKAITENFKKKEILQKKGFIPKNGFYVKKGLIRSYSRVEKGKENILFLIQKDDL